VHVDGPYIAITFDDGPHATLTPKLLDLLAARKVKATFFVVGQCVAEYPEITRRIVRDGHEIASHSWSHPNLSKMSDEAVRGQLQRTSDAIKAAAGVTPTVMRPPYGAITPRQKSWMFEEFGYRTIIWDVDPFDWKRPGPGVVTQRIVNQTQPGSIILAHDIHAQTIDAMPATLDQLLQKGFKFVTVSELLAMAKPGPRPTVAKAAPAPGADSAANPKAERRQPSTGAAPAESAGANPAPSPARSASRPNG
jgi:peptidoglycan-N-acetylglucosamine deacetylase